MCQTMKMYPKNLNLRKFSCEKCDSTFQNKNHAKEHQIKSLKINKPHNCEFCAKKFCDKSTLSLHLKETHEKSNSSSREIDIKAKSPKIKDIDKKLNFQCQFCDQKFDGKRTRDIHEKIRNSDGPFKCNLCPFKHCLPNGLSPHIRKVHKNSANLQKRKLCQSSDEKSSENKIQKKKSKVEENQENLDNNSDSKSLNIDCQFCDQTFVSKQSQSYHKENRKSNVLYKCHLCTYRNCFKVGLSLHSNMAHLYCLKCKQKFESQALKTTHTCTIECEICGKRLSVKQLNRHTVNVHLKCYICDKTFQNSEDCIEHMWNVHKFRNPKTLSCKHCDAKFKSSSNLNLHMRNSDGKTLKCEKCPSKFCHKMTLAQHMNMKHASDFSEKEILKLKSAKASDEELKDDSTSQNSNPEKQEKVEPVYNVLPKPKKGQWIVRLQKLK